MYNTVWHADILFGIFINDSLIITKDGEIRSFADDTTFCFTNGKVE